MKKKTDTLGQKQPTNLKIIGFKRIKRALTAMGSGGNKNGPSRRFVNVGIVWFNNGSNNTNTPTMAIRFPF
jgi:hypothetical protein